MNTETSLTVATAFAVLLVAPLALWVGRGKVTSAVTGQRTWNAIAVAAGCVGVSLTQAPGAFAATLTVPWLVIAFTFLIRELLTLALRKPRTVPGVAVFLPLLALVFFTVGASWLFLARAGLQPLGFSSFIVGLTAVHFHVAGLGGMTLASRTQLAARRGWKPATGIAGLVAAAGITIVAIGITGPNAGFPEVVALQAIGGSVVGIGFVTIAVTEVFGTSSRGASRVLFAAGIACLLAGMLLAVSYSTGVWLSSPALSIDQMIRTHGILNGVGFAFCGLVGWALRKETA